MGINIQAFMEYKKEKDDRWSLLGHVPLQEDIILFGLMGGAGYATITPVVPTRGLPSKDVSEEVFTAHFVAISDEPEDACTYGICSEEQAEDYIRNHGSHWADENHDFVSDPNYYLPSWLTLEELKDAIARKKTIKWEKVQIAQAADVGIDCTIACMEAAEKAGYKTRLVFWFF